VRRLMHNKYEKRKELTFPSRCPPDERMESQAARGNYSEGEATRTVSNSPVESAFRSCIGDSRGSVDALAGGLDSHDRESLFRESASA
jgi:hypothetical protein